MFNEQNPLAIFESIPKVELHVHLDCSLSYEFVSNYLPNLDYNKFKHSFIGPEKCRDLAHFLTFANQQIDLLQSEIQLRLAVKDVIKQLKHDNIIYAEIRFAPFLHTKNNLSTFEVVEIVLSEAKKWSEKWGIRVGFLLCTLRHFSSKQSMETFELVNHFIGKGVVGFDIAGDEAGFSLSEHKEAFTAAFKNDIPITAHAGEALGAKSVYETLKELKPNRIGHGVRSIEDVELVKLLAKNEIHLEVCPSTNIQIDVFKTYQQHPIDRLAKSGISVGINTDTRTITGIDLSKEYDKLYRAFGWNKETFYASNLHAIKASFTSDLVKKALINELEKGYGTIEPF